MVYFAARTPNAHVSDVTSPFPISNSDPCLRGIKLEKNETAATDVRTLPQEILPDTDNFRLATVRPDSRRDDPLLRLLDLSEIAFDTRHEYAILNYNFHCGPLCGEGSVVVFKKQQGKWKYIRSCGGWIS